ncbi:hypothetical protein C6B37_00355 [Candidatus Phytoplasma phoenicium]|uniref:Uncharacterized protein n=1 Tax=Candidatus Phytoplasma phoenicium TaxID=198422 RepID=A0A2S8NVF9_9MOLU|nr:hypothetical protein C6B37_00355 [Candidatus Phytoplasma phoenicium]
MVEIFLLLVFLIILIFIFFIYKKQITYFFIKICNILFTKRKDIIKKTNIYKEFNKKNKILLFFI